MKPDEQVVWAAQPLIEAGLKEARIKLIAIRSMMLFFWIIPVAMIVGAPLIGIPTLLVFAGLTYFFWGSMERERKKLELSACVVTNQRAMNLTLPRKVAAYPPKYFTNFKVTEKPDGSGSITFYEATVPGPDGASNTMSYGFSHIPAVREAERHLRALMG